MGSAVDNSGAERHRTKTPSNRRDETSAALGGLSQALDPVETSFTSLIQQYLGLLQYDNATFLAERLVAHKSSPHAIYLLAMCYYRKGSPKSARSVLLNLSRSRFRASSTNNKKHNVTKDDLLEDNILYLLSKCCLDLSLYAEAEEVILRRARFQYTSAKKNGTNSSKETLEEWLSRTNQTETYQIPNGAVGLGLLGDICRKTRRRDKAALFYRMSLQLDPLLWTSYEALCEMGISSPDLDPSKIFGVVPEALLNLPESRGGYGPNVQSHVSGEYKEDANGNDEFLRRVRESDSPFTVSNSPIFARAEENEMNHRSDHVMEDTADPPFGTLSTPHAQNDNYTGQRNNNNTSSRFTTAKKYAIPPFSTAKSTLNRSRMPSKSLFATPNLTPIQPEQVVTQAKLVASRLYYEPSPEMTPPHLYHAPPHSSLKLTRGKRSRNNRRLIGLDFEEEVEENKEDGEIEVRNVNSKYAGNRVLFKAPESLTTVDGSSDINEDKGSVSFKRETNIPKEDSVESESEGDGIKHILELFCILGAAQRMLCSFRCEEAIQIFQRLPHNHFETGWVQHQVGRAHFEVADYPNAQRSLETMERLCPYRMKGLELLSTCLWHLKRDVELSNLAQRAVDFDQMSPEAWCVVGNCFSLQKEHETALTFFRRSLQVDPNFTYSHTLSGHEFVSNEDFEQAAVCYRNAIRVDDRHYNAWYGLGAIYFRQEKYELAEYHFHKALSINPQSSVLHCHLGMAQHANGKPQEALDTLSNAFRVDPRNPQARYQRATIWMSMDKPKQALAEFEKVRDAAPRESSVHFAMGRVLKRLGRQGEAMRCFLTALDLDPKDNNLIKAAIDRLDEPDIDEDVSAF